MLVEVSPQDARDFIRRANFQWYQRFQLAAGVYTPGVNDVEWILQQAQLPPDLRGKSVLDIGANNGAICFESERRGARRVVGVDIMSPEFFGFDPLRRFLRSSADYVNSSVYELPAAVTEEFDIVFFLGVLYHLRHPLLALDNLRSVVREYAIIETAVSDHELGNLREAPVARFYRRAELGGDASNWFAPTIACLLDWCWSAGLRPCVLGVWPEESPQRCMVRVEPIAGDPEYQVISYERPIRIVAGRE